MKNGRFKESTIFQVLKEAEAGIPVPELCRKHGMSNASFYNPPGPEFPRYELLDQIWVSQQLSDRFSGPTIDRRSKHGGDGSDHDPAWIDLAL